MTKRFLSLVLALVLLVLTVPASVLAEDDTVPASAGYYYVYTENGKGLNVRDMPNGTKVGSLKYGSRIYCYYVSDGWALIDYTYDKPNYGKGTYACFVSARFLTKNKPADRTPSTTPAPKSTTDSATTVAELNVEFASAKKVEPYLVTVRPTRVTGWVNMRWAPSKNSTLMATYKANDQLLVIRETKNWLQVQDPETGNVGFISKSFVQN